MDKNQGESGNERDAYRGMKGGRGEERREEREGGNVSMARYERLPTEGAWNDEMGLK